jgi:glycosyltransferase involved in cell wall biosynthesis
VKKHSRSGTGPVIVQILPALVRGGVERGTVEMAEAIVAAGGRAVVISNGGGMERHLLRCGAVHYQLPVHVKNPLKWWSLRHKVAAILRQENADIVHLRSRVPAWIALPVARRLGLITVATVHGRFVPKTFLKRVYSGKMLKADHVIAISHYVKNLITRSFFGVEEKLTVVHRGVDTEVFDAAKVSQSRIVRFVEEIGLPEDMPLVMLPARPTGWKGHEVLLEALAEIKHLPFLCVFLGAADGRPAFIEKITEKGIELGLEGRFRLVKSVEDMPAALMVADVVVMPSVTPEPFGRVALEAQAMGRPVIAFNHGGAVESISHEETGWLAEPNDLQDLSRCIAEALKLSARKRTALAKATRRHIEESFSTAKMCRETIKIYARLLAKASTPRDR